MKGTVKTIAHGFLETVLCAGTKWRGKVQSQDHWGATVLSKTRKISSQYLFYYSASSVSIVIKWYLHKIHLFKMYFFVESREMYLSKSIRSCLTVRIHCPFPFHSRPKPCSLVYVALGSNSIVVLWPQLKPYIFTVNYHVILLQLIFNSFDYYCLKFWVFGGHENHFYWHANYDIEQCNDIFMI